MKISIYLASGLIFTSLVLGLTIGYYLAPEYQNSMYRKNSMDLGPADRSFDLRYLRAMIAHHREAILLAEQLSQNSQRPEMKALAQNILNDEPTLIDELYRWKKDWYNDSRKVTDNIAPNLGPADDKFDLRFLNALIFHHEAGIIMTKETRLKSSRPEVLNNADAVENFLTETLKTLRGLRKDWYNL